jgi:hypothetical protein
VNNHNLVGGGGVFSEIGHYMRFQVLTATNMKMAVFWDVAPCGLVDFDRRFRSTYCLHHEDHPEETDSRLQDTI